MSRIINRDVSGSCRPWHAPSLDITNDTNYDFKLVRSENINHGEQHEQIRQQSYEKSYAKGYMEGMAKGQAEINEQVKSLHSLMAVLAMPLPDLDDLVVDELVQLCMFVVKQMVRRELKISPGEIVAVVKEALSLLPVAAAEITLELHPDDAKIIRDALVCPDSEASWKIVEDSLLTCGGCRVLTNTSRIDATVENRINTVISEVVGGERKVDGS